MRSFVVSEEEGVLTCEVRESDVGPGDPSDILVAVEFSGVNYKDALVASAHSRVRRLPLLIAGVDASGTSRSPTIPLSRRRPRGSARRRPRSRSRRRLRRIRLRARSVSEPPTRYRLQPRRDGHRHRGLHGHGEHARTGTPRPGRHGRSTRHGSDWRRRIPGDHVLARVPATSRRVDRITRRIPMAPRARSHAYHWPRRDC